MRTTLKQLNENKYKYIFITIHEDGTMSYTQKHTECPQGMIRLDKVAWLVPNE